MCGLFFVNQIERTPMQEILDKFQNLGRYKGKAPHKPLLVLALLDWIEALKLEENSIPLNKGLFERFEYYWDELHGTKGTKRIQYPILYLKSDGLGWKVVVNGELLSGEKGKRYLEGHGATGHFAEEVWQFLASAEHRDLVRLAIMETYFPEKKSVIFPKNKPYSLDSYEGEFFEDRKSPYRIKMVKQAGFVRTEYFRIRLLGVYRNTCAMTQMHIDPPGRILQACHIKQHASTGNNSVNNGIVLSANMHTAFDQGYVGIDRDYSIMVNDTLFEESNGDYSLMKLKGNPLFLPDNQRYWPAQEHLEKHRRQFFS